jgi:hypothetical protein
MLAITVRWETIRKNRNKLKNTKSKSVIKRKQEKTCDTLKKPKRDATDGEWTLSDRGN